jgi:hypothetical protein
MFASDMADGGVGAVAEPAVGVAAAVLVVFGGAMAVVSTGAAADPPALSAVRELFDLQATNVVQAIAAMTVAAWRN